MVIKNNFLLVNLFVIFGLLNCSCQLRGTQKNQDNIMYSPLEYNIAEPELSTTLPKKLKEISGMVMFDEEHLLAIQDEDGILFKISAKDGEIAGVINFADEGDFEGVTLAGNTVFILRSDGTIFELSELNFVKEKANVKSFKVELDSINNPEGICYDEKNNSLLIACKDRAFLVGEDSLVHRAVYRFDLNNRKLKAAPAYLLSLQQLITFLEIAPKEDEYIQELKNIFEGEPDELFIYPSDIAIHPLSGDLYISSARTINCLLVLSFDGKLKSIVKIPKDLMEQPEGICFNKKGDMYLSSEGKADDDRLFIYEWQKN
jgi:hypothetical protein